MTKAKALRNYLNAAFGLQLDGMSQTEVMRQFLHEQFDFDSTATSPVGVLQEMAANNLVPNGGGSSQPQRVDLAEVTLWPNEDAQLIIDDESAERFLVLGPGVNNLRIRDKCVLSFYNNGELVNSYTSTIQDDEYYVAIFDCDIAVGDFNQSVQLHFFSEAYTEEDCIADLLGRFDADEISVQYYRIVKDCELEVLLNYTIGANEVVTSDQWVGDGTYYPALGVPNAKPGSDPEMGDILYFINSATFGELCGICDIDNMVTTEDFKFAASTIYGFQMLYIKPQQSASAAKDVADQIAGALEGTQIIILKAPSLPEPTPTPEPEPEPSFDPSGWDLIFNALMYPGITPTMGNGYIELERSVNPYTLVDGGSSEYDAFRVVVTTGKMPSDIMVISGGTLTYASSHGVFFDDVNDTVTLRIPYSGSESDPSAALSEVMASWSATASGISVELYEMGGK